MQLGCTQLVLCCGGVLLSPLPSPPTISLIPSKYYSTENTFCTVLFLACTCTSAFFVPLMLVNAFADLCTTCAFARLVLVCSPYLSLTHPYKPIAHQQLALQPPPPSSPAIGIFHGSRAKIRPQSTVLLTIPELCNQSTIKSVTEQLFVGQSHLLQFCAHPQQWQRNDLEKCKACI